MIIDKAYGSPYPESHLMVEITPSVLREIANRLEERAKVTDKDRVLTIKLTRDITLAYQVEDKYNGIQINSAKETPSAVSPGGEIVNGYFFADGTRHRQEEIT